MQEFIVSINLEIIEIISNKIYLL